MNFPHFVAGKTVPAFPLVAVVAEEPAFAVYFFADFPQRNIYWLWIRFLKFLPLHPFHHQTPLFKAEYRRDVHDVITKLKVCNNVVQFEAKVLKAKTKKSLLRTVRITPELDEILQKDGTVLISADHGNAEKMADLSTDKPFTAHTPNKVPFLLISKEFRHRLRKNGILADIAPTILDILGIEKPKEMTGTSLIEN